MRRFIVLTAATALAVTAFAGSAAAQDPVNLRVLVHQNPPFVAFMEQFNEQFEANHPDINVEMAVVNANELMTSTQTRLMANDVDVIDIFAFSNAAEPYMEGTDPPGWQSLIDAGLLMDLTDQPFVANYDAASIADAGTYNDRVYQVNLGRVGFSGVYYNKDVLRGERHRGARDLVRAGGGLRDADVRGGALHDGGRRRWLAHLRRRATACWGPTTRTRLRSSRASGPAASSTPIPSGSTCWASTRCTTAT